MYCAPPYVLSIYNFHKMALQSICQCISSEVAEPECPLILSSHYLERKSHVPTGVWCFGIAWYGNARI